MANFLSWFNQTTDRGNTTTKPHKLVLCPGILNTQFETLDSSVPYFVNAALNAALAIATSFANVLVLLAMRRVTSIRLPSKLLLCSLVLADLGAGSVVQPQIVWFQFGRALYPGLVECALFRSILFTGSTLTYVSFLTLTAVSLDRYAALFFHLKYQQIVTTRRVCAVLAFIWSLAFLVASTTLWYTKVWLGLTVTVGVVTYPVISVVCIKIYRRLRAQQVQHQAPDQAQQQAGNSPNMARYRRTASAMMWVYVLFLLCYVPHTCWGLIVESIGRTTLTACFEEYTYTIILLNSFINPFVYCLRLPDVRTEVIKRLRKLCCRSSQQ